MTIKITIKMDGAAFEPVNGNEIARMLRQLEIRVDGTHLPKGWERLLVDMNGNTVGEAKVTQ